MVKPFSYYITSGFFFNLVDFPMTEFLFEK